MGKKEKNDRVLEVNGVLPFRCVFEKDATSGGMFMTLGDCCVTAEQDGRSQRFARLYRRSRRRKTTK